MDSVQMHTGEVDPPEVSLVKGYLKTLREMTEEREELRAFTTQLFTAAEAAELDDIDRKVAELTSRKETLHADMRERDAQLFADLATADKEIADKELALKKACYSFPVGSFRATQYIRSNGMRVTIGTARVTRTYRSEMLVNHPELRSVAIDGDPVVKASIDTAVLDRLIAENKFREEDAAPYRIETKTRNPSVRTVRAEED